MQLGRNVLPSAWSTLGFNVAPNNPIDHYVNYATGTIINEATPEHVFQGTVVHQYTVADGRLFVTTRGTGPNSSWINARANELVGYTYFYGWHLQQRMGMAQHVRRMNGGRP